MADGQQSSSSGNNHDQPSTKPLLSPRPPDIISQGRNGDEVNGKVITICEKILKKPNLCFKGFVKHFILLLPFNCKSNHPRSEPTLMINDLIEKYFLYKTRLLFLITLINFTATIFLIHLLGEQNSLFLTIPLLSLIINLNGIQTYFILGYFNFINPLWVYLSKYLSLIGSIVNLTSVIPFLIEVIVNTIENKEESFREAILLIQQIVVGVLCVNQGTLLISLFYLVSSINILTIDLFESSLANALFVDYKNTQNINNNENEDENKIIDDEVKTRITNRKEIESAGMMIRSTYSELSFNESTDSINYTNNSIKIDNYNLYLIVFLLFIRLSLLIIILISILDKWSFYSKLSILSFLTSSVLLQKYFSPRVSSNYKTWAVNLIIDDIMKINLAMDLTTIVPFGSELLLTLIKDTKTLILHDLNILLIIISGFLIFFYLIEVILYIGYTGGHQQSIVMQMLWNLIKIKDNRGLILKDDYLKMFN